MKYDEKIIETLFAAIDEINEFLPAERHVEKSADTVIFGAGGKLDSIGLVSFIVAAEQKLAEIQGITLTLADERAMSQKNSPFRTVGTLAQYISSLMMEQKDA